jgi:peptidoglycan hydrolase-like protein with peptidoglycan-binding domain
VGRPPPARGPAPGPAGRPPARDGTDATADQPAPSLPTATVVRETLAHTRSFTGTLGRGEPTTVRTPGQGTLTGLANQRTPVTAGSELFRIDERPTTAMYGTVPMYRDVRSGDSGSDVAQLEAGLAALGYDGFTVDDHYTSATAAAVRRWQADLGVPETGVVARADVVFVSEGTRVDTVHVRVGDPVTPGAPVLDLAGSDHVVALEVAVRDRDPLAVGTDVAVRLPGDLEVPGVVTTANAVAANDGETVIRVEVTLTEAVDETLLGATAEVVVEVDERTDVLAVPVNALLALADGGHGLEVVAGNGSTTIVPVDTGLFAAGRVEVSGDGIDEGTVVVVAAR